MLGLVSLPGGLVKGLFNLLRFHLGQSINVKGARQRENSADINKQAGDIPFQTEGATEAWHSDDYFGTPGIFTAPWWPVKLVIILSAGLCCLLWLAKALTGKRSLEHVHLANGD